MIVYLVKGSVDRVGYNESVRVMDRMEEKPKSYVGMGCRIDKSKIGKLEEGMFRDQYQIYLIDENEIGAARKRIKEQVLKVTNKKFEEYKLSLENLNNHSLESDITFREY